MSRATPVRGAVIFRRPLAALGLVLALTLTACGGGDETAGEPTLVRVNTLQAAADVPVYLALERGYFAEQGLDVELVPVKNTSDLPALLAAGEIDFALAQPNATFFNAAAGGFEDPVVLATNTYSPDTRIPGLVVREQLLDSGEVTGVADLAGRTVAIIGPSTSSQFFVEQALAGAGVDAASVELTVMGLPDMLTALSTGAVDAAWMFEPLATRAVQHGIGRVVASVGDVAPGFPSWVQASGSIADDDPDAVSGFVTAVLSAMRDYNEMLPDDRGAVVDVLTEYTTMTETADWEGVELPAVSDDGAFDIEIVKSFQDYLRAKGAVGEAVDVGSLFDLSHRDAALRLLD